MTALQAHFLNLLRPILRATPEILALYSSPRGGPALIGEGERLRNPDLAALLELMAVEGGDVFYRGAIARALVEDLRGGGLIGLGDLAAYRTEIRAPARPRLPRGRGADQPAPLGGGRADRVRPRPVERPAARAAPGAAAPSRCSPT